MTEQTPITPPNTETATALITARWLSTHRIIFGFNIANLILLGMTSHHGLVVLALAIFAILLYLHIRLEFDTRIFIDFATQRLTPADFDMHLQRITQAAPKNRTMSERVKGGLRLYKQLLALSVSLFTLSIIAQVV